MNEYLYEITCDKFLINDLSDEEIVYVMADEKLHVNRKRKLKVEVIIVKVI